MYNQNQIMRILIFFTLALFSLGCSDKEELPVRSDIVGKWKLIEFYADPGNGSGKFTSIKSNKTLEFSSNGDFSVKNGSMCNLDLSSNESRISTYAIDSTDVKDNFRLKIKDCSLELYCSVQGDILTIYFPCIEGCGEKYRRIN